MSVENSGSNTANRISNSIAAPMVTLQADKSFTFWLYMRTGVVARTFINLMRTSQNRGIQMGMKPYDPSFGCWMYGGTYYISQATLPSYNEWHFIAYTYTASTTTHTLSIDGATPITAVVASQSGNVEICDVAGNAYGEPLDGFMDDTRIYNRPLSRNEIQTIYSLRGNDHIVNGLLSRWTFTEGATGTAITSVRDISGNAHNSATIYGSLTYSDVSMSFTRRSHRIRKS
jgi:hypothetical protein